MFPNHVNGVVLHNISIYLSSESDGLLLQQSIFLLEVLRSEGEVLRFKSLEIRILSYRRSFINFLLIVVLCDIVSFYLFPLEPRDEVL